MIPLRILGNTDIKISVIGLGTVKFGRNQNVKYPQEFKIPTDKEIDSLLNVANTLGINFLDTAPAYGNSEERIGAWLKRKGQRSDWVIASKFGEVFKNGVSYFDFTKQAAFNSVDQSLKRLGTDYLDLLLVHSDGNDKEIINKYKVFETLAEIKKMGKIRAFGMSTKTVEGGLLTVEMSDVAMVTFNPLEVADHEVINYAYKMGKGILIKKALVSGHLHKISQEGNPVEKSIHFILKQPGVTSIVIGTLNIQHLQEAVGFIKSFNSKNRI